MRSNKQPQFSLSKLTLLTVKTKYVNLSSSFCCRPVAKPLRSTRRSIHKKMKRKNLKKKFRLNRNKQNREDQVVQLDGLKGPPLPSLGKTVNNFSYNFTLSKSQLKFSVINLIKTLEAVTMKRRKKKNSRSAKRRKMNPIVDPM